MKGRLIADDIKEQKGYKSLYNEEEQEEIIDTLQDSNEL